MVAGKPVWAEFVRRRRETRRRDRDSDRWLGGGGIRRVNRVLDLETLKTLFHENCVLTLNLFLQQKSCFSMGLISLDTKNKTLFLCLNCV